jgi:hypothetical protein
MTGQTNLFDVPECEEFYSCVFEAACAQTGAQRQICEDTLKQVLQSSACADSSADLAAACAEVKANAASTYPQCAN